MSTEVDNYLEHYGVKGMKWGKRQKHTEKRREYRARVRQERQAFQQKHLGNVLKESMKKGEDVLVKTTLQGDYAQTIMTGKQFVEMASKGALLDAKTTDVFARLDKDAGQFVLNDQPNEGYKKSARR
ncbi:hypothetical protein SEA_NIGHTMARE_11 [Arthrobacter phage Nightmare]|uniref:Uncharacterized protein n=1 Tax=Arthrobacter phage Nightmare TaxID=2015864 RepID=A0A221J6F6_9CAUD|nr:hypothetical protein QCN33_gp11 [Arthrobacter phage Nightmare]ASM62287.1 hypothetical protein SEA_NIGHTMARE_11 [Arthrobacter phage Nightmare]